MRWYRYPLDPVMDVDICCPRWELALQGKVHHEHDPGCYYAPETWPRVGRALVGAVADWLEKKMILSAGVESDPTRSPHT